MELSKRQRDLLICLYKYPSQSMEIYSRALDISITTYRNELKILLPLLEKHHVKIRIDRDNHIWVEHAQGLYAFLLEHRKKLEFSLENKILLLLLLSPSFVTTQEIAEVTFVSQSKINKLIPKLIKKHNPIIQSLRHYGIHCTLSEHERREYFTKLVFEYFVGICFEEDLKEFHNRHFPILDYMDSHTIGEVKRAVDAIKQDTTLIFTDESMVRIFLSLLIGNHRFRHHKASVSTMYVDLIQTLTFSVDLSYYKQLVHQISQYYSLGTCKQEQAYLTYLFVTLRKQNLYRVDDILIKMQPFITKILHTIKEKMGVYLEDNEALIRNLSLHIYHTVLRKNLLVMEHVSEEWRQLSLRYPISYEMALIASDMVYEEFEYNFSYDEKIYLLLHFQVAIETIHTHKKVRVGIVCHYGIAAANLIAHRITNMFQEVVLIGMYSIRDWEHLSQGAVDLILSTEPMKVENIPVIYVSPSLEEAELDAVFHFIKHKHHTSEHLIEESQVLSVDAETKAQALEVCIAALDDYVVKDSFKQSVMDREGFSPTDCGIFAIPHGDPNYVITTKLVIGILSSPILWNASKIEYIFLLAISKEDYEHHLRELTAFYRNIQKINVYPEALKGTNVNTIKHTLLTIFHGKGGTQL